MNAISMDDLRKRKILKYRTQEIILRAIRVLTILSAGCVIWELPFVLASAMVLGQVKIVSLLHYVRQLAS